MRVDFRPDGIYLPELDLWLDPEGDRPFAFLSHGHADHVGGQHGQVFCTPATSDIYRLRGGEQAIHHAHPFGEPFEHRGARLTLYPAGHILGAAQLLVESNGERLVYTGDLKVDAPLCADPDVIVPCDHLIIESTFGLPIFRFLSAAEARTRIVEHARAALAEGATPLLLGYPLGRSQEIVEVLTAAEIPVAAHGAVAKYLDIYRRHTGRLFEAIPYERGQVAGHAIVGPPSFARQIGKSAGRLRVIAVSGWALLDSARTRYDADILIPYSDHASFPELLRYVEESKAKRVDVVHGFAEPLAQVLRSKGVDAHAQKAAAKPLDQEEVSL